jgi:hypothetical protein
MKINPINLAVRTLVALVARDYDFAMLRDGAIIAKELENAILEAIYKATGKMR